MTSVTPCISTRAGATRSTSAPTLTTRTS
jgi:hypothetical protein